VVTADDVDGAVRALEDARIPIVLCDLELEKDTWKAILAGATGRPTISDRGIPPGDPVQAELWASLAAKKNLPFYKSELDGAESQMTPSEIVSGRALAAAWKPMAGHKPQVGEEFPKEGTPKSQED
jgi:hypothetical protein